MTYNADKPKMASFIAEKDKEKDKKIPFFRFYGTDSENNRTTYLDSISNEMQNSIVKPMQTTYSSFFKPFSDTSTAVGKGIIDGLIITAAVFKPDLLIGYVCFGSALHLLTAFISLCKGIYATTQGDHNTAAEFYLDATTRTALILPLLALNTVLLPIEIISFFTQSIASLIEYARGVKPSAADADADADAGAVMLTPAISA